MEGTHTSISFALGADFLVIISESYTKLRADIVTPALFLGFLRLGVHGAIFLLISQDI